MIIPVILSIYKASIISHKLILSSFTKTDDVEIIEKSNSFFSNNITNISEDLNS